MTPLLLHDQHQAAGARFGALAGCEIVEDYGNAPAEYASLQTSVGMLDFSFRGRLCLLGNDRVPFLNGQVTNNVKSLKAGEGCYAALVTAKGKMQSDLNIYLLENELLLDFEPGLSEMVQQRLEKFIIADDVQIMDVAPHYGLLTLQGPRAIEFVKETGLAGELPAKERSWTKTDHASAGEIYWISNARLGSAGIDCYVPVAGLSLVFDALALKLKTFGGSLCGWQAFEISRIEKGIPRFGADMNESNLAPEGGIESRAISYNKGCYIGQEVIARIRTYGQVAKSLRRLSFEGGMPNAGDRLFHAEKEVGYVTSAVFSPSMQKNLGLGYVRKEVNGLGGKLVVKTAGGEVSAVIEGVPFSS